MMSPTTFDDPVLYPAIRVITEILSDEAIDKNIKRSAGSFITQFNTMIKQAFVLENTTYDFKIKIIQLIKYDYLNKLELRNVKQMSNQALYTHLRNYVMAKSNAQLKYLRYAQKRSTKIKREIINLSLE